MRDLQMKVRRCSPTATLPAYQSAGAAGLDLHANEDVMLDPGHWHAFHTGIAIELPPGYEGQVRPRSGLAKNHGITVLNAPGTVDADFRGELRVMLVNHGFGAYVVRRGDRIAQLVIAPVVRAEIMEAEDLTETDRGEGWAGSTGR